MKAFENLKLIKSIANRSFEVELWEMNNGMYRILYSGLHNEPSVSEAIKDFYTASFMFDLKVKELEGH